jgi:uncharacterized protein YkwD
MRFSAWKKHETPLSIVTLIFFTLFIILFIFQFYTLLSKESRPAVYVTKVSGISDVKNKTISISLTPSVTENPVPTVYPTKPPEISERIAVLNALNNYRQKNGASALQIDEKLHSFAQGRADVFSTQGSMDNHVGFQSMLNENGFSTLGFNALGENSSFGEWGSALNLIEALYASSSQHNASQLSNEWTHVGIGISGTATNIVFGGKKR